MPYVPGVALDSKTCDPKELARLVRSQDDAALDQLTRCYGQRLVAVGQSRCGSRLDPEDAVQDALLSATRHLHTYRAEGSLEGWLVRMVINACHRMRRGLKNDSSLHDVGEELISDEEGPDELAGREQVALALGQTLGKLSPVDRAILLMAEVEDWRGPEIAAELGMSPGAVRTRLSRTRARVRQELEPLL